MAALRLGSVSALVSLFKDSSIANIAITLRGHESVPILITDNRQLNLAWLAFVRFGYNSDPR